MSRMRTHSGQRFQWRLQYFIESFERYLPDRKACSFLYLAIHGKFWLSPEFTGLNVSVPSLLRQFEASRAQRVTRVFNSSRQIGKLGQADTAIGCLLRNAIYKLTAAWLADLQFKWLFDYQPQWNQSLTNHSE